MALVVFALGAAAGAGATAALLRRAGATKNDTAVNGAPSSSPAAAAAKTTAPHTVPPPHPGWRPGQPQPPPYGADAPMLTLDPATVDKPSMYALVISAVVPRPIAFVSTASADGGRNLAPYSYFNVMCHNPPVVTIGMCRSPGRGGGKKDSLINIEETGEFVVNIISDWFVEAANHTCGDFDRGVDEMALSGLTPVASDRVRPPRVGEAAVQMECRLRAIHEVTDAAGNPTAAVVIGEVILFHIAEAVTARSPTGKITVDPTALKAVGRMGGVTYGRVTELYDMPRPDKNGVYPQPTTPASGSK